MRSNGLIFVRHHFSVHMPLYMVFDIASFAHNDAHVLEQDLKVLEKRMLEMDAAMNVTLGKVKNSAEKYIPVYAFNCQLLRSRREMVTCQDYNVDASSGVYEVDAKKMFASQLKTVDKILFVTHTKRDYQIVDNLSQQKNRTVMFDQEIDIDATKAKIKMNFKNMKKIVGRICVLAQGQGQ